MKRDLAMAMILAADAAKIKVDLVPIKIGDFSNFAVSFLSVLDFGAVCAQIALDFNSSPVYCSLPAMIKELSIRFLDDARLFHVS